VRIPALWGMRTVAFLAVVLTIAGCASTGGIGPHEHTLDAGKLDAGAAIAAAEHDAQWPASDWWHGYRDPQLDTLIDAALSGSPTLAAAQARVRAAQSMADVARAAEAPQVDGSLSLERQHWPDNIYYGPATLANSNTWNNTGVLSFSYHLDVWGKDRNSTEEALDAAHAAAADARAARLELELNVVRSYVDFAKNYALLDIAREAYGHQQEFANLAHQRLQAGLGTQLEVSQAEAPLPDDQRQIHADEEALALNRSQLAALIGQGPGAGDRLTRPVISLGAPGFALPSTLPADLIGRRPDVVAARWRVEAQTHGIAVAKAAFYPDVNLAGTLGAFGVTAPFGEFLRAVNGGWSAGPALSLPIFDGGRLRAELGGASAGYDQAVAQYNSTLLDALRQISDNIVRLRALQTQRQDAAQSIALAQRAFELAHEGFRRGLTDYTNVLIAQNQLLRAEDGAARIAAEQLASHAALMAALGGGLETGNDAAAAPEAAASSPSVH
jgi:NodT family efflux transporter outer membrane factor (OMF) lipoprotein